MASVAALKGCALFNGFTQTGLQIIAAIASDRVFPKGVPLFVENMVGDSLLIVSRGKVRLTAKNRSGQEVTVGELGPGDCLGELSLIQEGQRMCTATAMLEVTAVEIRRADFQKLLGQKPQACVKLLMGIVALFGKKVSDSREAFKSLLTKS
jgi:CRP-like cAMP-binding protein